MPLWGCEMLGINSADPLHPIKLFATNLVFMLNLCIRFSLKDEIGACAVTFLLVIQSALFLCVISDLFFSRNGNSWKIVF